ncbi:uncharacterized protein LOC125940331 [Dermacentor silvarum]|uniref:uncharacterized protein LOC125940331 n=1 Tax=Dermacentor silvarum TaxID=543639 RepID=UPI0021006A47|nr:uncharacterized protein LOC125940331 [Dermacentor silvarum]
MCKDDIKMSINESDIYFYRGFKGEWRLPTLLHGLFFSLPENIGSSSLYNAMNVTSTNHSIYPQLNYTPWGSTEVLLSATNDSICGVFNVTLSSNGAASSIYEVRVRNDKNMSEILKVCLNYTSEHISQQNFTECTLFA